MWVCTNTTFPLGMAVHRHPTKNLRPPSITQSPSHPIADFLTPLHLGRGPGGRSARKQSSPRLIRRVVISQKITLQHRSPTHLMTQSPNPPVTYSPSHLLPQSLTPSPQRQHDRLLQRHRHSSLPRRLKSPLISRPRRRRAPIEFLLIRLVQRHS